MTKKHDITLSFEDALHSGLKGVPIPDEKGGFVSNPDGGIARTVPEASFLSVVRAYLKDLMNPSEKTRVPVTGKPTGIMAEFQNKKLPFGVRAQ